MENVHTSLRTEVLKGVRSFYALGDFTVSGKLINSSGFIDYYTMNILMNLKKECYTIHAKHLKVYSAHKKLLM